MRRRGGTAELCLRICSAASVSLHLLPVSSFSSSQRSKLADVWLLDNCSVMLYHRVENFVKDAADRVAALLKSFLCHAVGRVLAEKYRKRLFH